MKNKSKNKAIKYGIAIMLVLLLVSVFAVLFIANNASATVEAFTNNATTFFNTRNGTRQINGNAPTEMQFACFDFQRNSENFTYISGVQIASLNDSRHNRTLGQQSTSIRNNATIQSVPTVTIFSPGQGGGAYNFSNNGSRNLAYNSNSMIEVLRRQSNANVYVVTSHIFYGNSNNFYEC